MNDDRQKEIVLASEEVQRRNVKAAVQFGNETRQMVREVGVIVDALQQRITILDKQLQQMRTQVAALQQQFYSKGTVSYTGDDYEEK